jgi:DNA-3-methyladenine glycosylase
MLNRPFFIRDTVNIALDLIGITMLISGQDESYIITETEAYHGYSDEASHASKSRTKRNEPMFLEGGHSYVYLIYGMHYCLNIVTDVQNYPAAVLIRGVYASKSEQHINGPGRVSKKLGINLAHNRLDLFSSESKISFYKLDNYDLIRQNGIQKTSRIGIKKGLEYEWRFVLPQVRKKSKDIS